MTLPNIFLEVCKMCSSLDIQGVHKPRIIQASIKKNLIDDNHNRCSNCAPTAIIQASILYQTMLHSREGISGDFLAFSSCCILQIIKEFIDDSRSERLRLNS